MKLSSRPSSPMRVSRHASNAAPALDGGSSTSARVSVNVTRAVPFGPLSHQCMDVYSPATSDGDILGSGAPCVLFVHGGGWKLFSRESHANVGRALARCGFVAALPSYRLSPVSLARMAPLYAIVSAVLSAVPLAIWALAAAPAPPTAAAVACFIVPLVMFVAVHVALFGICRTPVLHPTHLSDVSAAAEWMHTHAADFGGDPSRFAIAGHSAGAHLACMAAFAPGAPPIAAAVLISGPYDAGLMVSAAAFGWIDRYFRRAWYMYTAFGPDSSAWDASFPTGLLRARLQGVSARQPNGMAERFPFLLMNAERDWGTQDHTALLIPLLERCGHPTKVVAVPNSSHVSLVQGFDSPGSVSERVALPVIASWLRGVFGANVAPATLVGISPAIPKG